MVTTEELLRMADEAEAESLRLAKQARALREMALGPGAARLTVERTGGKVRDVTPATRQAISERFMAKGSNRNLDAARAAGIPSLRKLAKALGVSVSFLSQVCAGTRPMPSERAEKFREITGKAWK